MLDISNICRICLKEEDPKLPIFTENDDKSESKPTLPEKIMSFARVKVVKDDGLPMYICVKCYCQVDTTVEFKRLCEESFHFFTQQLDAFSDHVSGSRATSPCANGRRTDPKDHSDGQHWVIPEESIKTEEYEQEYAADEETPMQVFKITGNDEAWIDNCERMPGEGDDSGAIKCEPTWECPTFDFDLSTVKIENCMESIFEEDRNPLEINSDDVPRMARSKSPMEGLLIPPSSVEKTCKCRSCEMVFSNRREMGFHISVAHRRCGTCGKYFFTNKDKDGHKCEDTAAEDKPFIPNRIDKIGQCCRVCNKTVKQMRSHMAWHRKRKLKLAGSKVGQDPIDTFEPIIELNSTQAFSQDDESYSERRIKCHLCDAICSNQKGFKIHITCMHRDHRLVYVCLVCKSRPFFSRVRCKKHMIKKHGLLTNGNIRLELKHVADLEKYELDGLVEVQMGRKKNNIHNQKADKRMKKLALNNGDCLDRGSKSNIVKKRVQVQMKNGGTGGSHHRRNSLRATHPPFSTEVPIIASNFEVTHDSNGVKQYVCRGCNVNYKRYISAYNHYYTLSTPLRGHSK